MLAAAAAAESDSTRVAGSSSAGTDGLYSGRRGMVEAWDGRIRRTVLLRLCSFWETTRRAWCASLGRGGWRGRAW
jgi:hypothetical protein